MLVGSRTTLPTCPRPCPPAAADLVKDFRTLEDFLRSRDGFGGDEDPSAGAVRFTGRSFARNLGSTTFHTGTFQALRNAPMDVTMGWDAEGTRHLEASFYAFKPEGPVQVHLVHERRQGHDVYGVTPGLEVAVNPQTGTLTCMGPEVAPVPAP